MRKTTENTTILLSEKMALTTPELMAVLGCGRYCATEIGSQAQAKITIGKRVLWDASKVRKYLNSIATE